LGFKKEEGEEKEKKKPKPSKHPDSSPFGATRDDSTEYSDG
jgi:hypothetical protein